MPNFPNPLRRKHLRLRDFDYTQNGAYFVTICTHSRRRLLGDVVDDKVVLSAEGRIVLECWQDLTNHYPHIELDDFVVMPNHVHGIVVITDSDKDFSPTDPEARLKPATTKSHSLPEVIRGFKTFSARSINRLRNSAGEPVWQRNYYEHVIRDETSLRMIREYIVNNPAKWAEDRYNPGNAPSDAW